jgi:hypothetical protein
MIAQYKIDYLKQEIERYKLALRIADMFQNQLSADVSFSPCCYFTIDDLTREDLQLLMTLAPKWEKTYFDQGIYYKATIQDHEVTLIARANALPSTCKLVEEVQVIPAQPEKIVRRQVLKCDLKKSTHDETSSDDFGGSAEEDLPAQTNSV